MYRAAFKGFAAKIPAQAVEGLRRNPRIASVEPDQYLKLAAQDVPEATLRIDAAPAYKNARAKIDSIAGPDGSAERVDIDVAVLDSGIDRDHPDLNYAGGIDCTGLGRPGDDAVGNGGHGTPIAGIIGALDNDRGVVGVAPGARLWSVKVLNGQNLVVGRSFLCGIEYVTANASIFEIANASIAGFQRNADDGNCGGTYDAPSYAYHRAICSSVGAGVTWVVAAGNDCRDVADYYPAAYDEVITVSSMVDTDGRPGGSGPPTQAGNCVGDIASFSDDAFGVSNHGGDVDLAAPGVNVLTTKAGGGSKRVNGTSFAAPFVAGAAALYKARHSAAAPAQVRQALLDDRERVHLAGDPDGLDEGVVNVNDREPGWIDTTPPTGPTLTITETQDDEHVAGNTLYYNPAQGHRGNFVVTANSADPESGIAFVRFPDVFGEGGRDATGPFAETYSWVEGNSASGAKSVTSVNGAGLAATTPFVVTVDKANPAASIAVPTANATISGVQTIRVDAADNSGGSGAAQVEVRFCRGSSGCDFSDGTPVGIDIDAPYEFAWNTSGLTDGAYKLVARALDNVGNRTDTAGIAVTVSNTGMLRQPSNDASNVLSVTLAGVKP